ncbi:uncharacterized protein [Miscanthus floridulus]|uniref:uncharacterized protein n=1 Tax=Miscanthus floridulus TaxID=154761 RepID=UPI00345A2EFB
MRDTVQKLLLPRSRANPKEPVTQGEANEAATKQAGEEVPTPHEAEALELGEAEVPLVAEATEGEAKAPRTFEAEVVEAGASRASKAEVVDVEAPRTIEAEVVEAGAPETMEAEVAEAGLGAAKPAAQDTETEAKQEAASTKAVAEQLEVEQGAHLLTKGALAEAIKVAEASWVEALAWKEKAEGLKKEASRTAEASIVVQAVLEAEIWEHNAL